MTTTEPGLTPRQQFLSDLWDEHMLHEFGTQNTLDTLDTMVPGASVNHVPVITGGTGRSELGRFYAKWFIPVNPTDMEMTVISKTIGTDSLAFEFVATFTHSTHMIWLLPGIPPTGRRVELAAEAARKVLDPSLPSNELIIRAGL